MYNFYNFIYVFSNKYLWSTTCEQTTLCYVWLLSSMYRNTSAFIIIVKFCLDVLLGFLMYTGTVMDDDLLKFLKNLEYRQYELSVYNW